MVVDDGETVMVCVVAPVLHRYEAKPGPAFRMTLPPHDDVGPVMVTGGGVQFAALTTFENSDVPLPIVEHAASV